MTGHGTVDTPVGATENKTDNDCGSGDLLTTTLTAEI
jgi:hypothetical protein